jgi:PAS domain S-box-containing protein
MTQRGINVLLVEDSSSDALLLQEALAKTSLSNFNIACVETLSDCLNTLQASFTDVILLDLQLPDSAGISTFLTAQAQAGRVPIIVLTGLDDRAIALQSLQCGAEDYIVKGSFDGEFLARSLLFAIERKRSQSSIDIQLKVSEAIAKFDSIEECMANVLAAICEWLLWDFGVFWMIDAQSRVGQCKSVWSRSYSSTADLQEATEKSRFMKGDGLPGIAWEQDKLVFVADLADETRLPVPASATKSGMGAALAFPVKVGEKTLGVLEFLSRRIHPSDNDDLMKVFEVIGSQIGQFLARKEAQHEQLQLAAIVSSCGDAIISKDLNGIITSWNNAAEKLYGYTAEEAIGNKISIIVPPDVNDVVTERLQQVFQGATLENIEAIRVRKNGERINIAVTISPLTNSVGQIIGASTVTRDITRQKFTEEKLKDTRERLDLAISASRIGLWDWNLHDGKVRWDKSMYELYGVSEEHFVPSLEAFLQLVHSDDRNRIEETIDSALASSSVSDFDYRIVFPDATVHYILTKGKVFSDRESKPARMTGVSIDITDLKSAENALLDSEQRLRLALEAAKMAVWDLDLRTNNVWRSPRHDQIFGYESNLPQWTRQTFLDRIFAEDLALVREKQDSALVDGILNMQFRITHVRDQSLHWLWVHGEAYKNELGEVIRMIGTVTEITEAKKLEQEANEARQRRDQILQSIVEHAPIGIAIFDSDLKVVNANAAFASMINRSVEQLLSLSLKTVLPDSVITAADTAVKSDRPFQVSRLPVAVTDQSLDERYWDLSIWPVVNDKLQLVGAVLQVIDCTDTVLLEQQRDDFVASVAHDIKNPLIGAQRIFDTLCSQSYSSSPDTHTAMLTVLKESNQNLLSLLQNLIDVYRYETLAYPCQFEEINLRHLFDNCAKQIASFAESRHVKVQISTSDLDYVIQADAIGIRRIMMNLLHNAVKFSKQGEKVEVAIKQLDHFIEIRITDNGDGIDEFDQKKLFKRFSQGSAGKKSAGGTGLGLYLCKQIIDAHQGSITCESALGSGTSFVVSLPITQLK